MNLRIKNCLNQEKLLIELDGTSTDTNDSP
jgi:hypothetical protein